MSCFMKQNGTTEDVSASATSCGNPSSEGIASCCYNGDTCMSDGFCQYTHFAVGGSGFYRAGCTDSTYNSPDCPPECSDEASPEAVYDFATGSWNCCGGSPATGLSCNAPTGPSFTSPAPAQLAALRNGIVVSASTAAAAGATSTLSTSSRHRGNGHHDAHGLSSQTVIGISIGASVAAVTLVLMAFVVLYRIRQRRKQQPFRRGSEPALLPASVRNSEHGPDGIRAPPRAVVSSPSHPLSISSMSNMSMREAHLRPLPLRQATDVSDLSWRPTSASRRSVSTWSSFSSGDREEEQKPRLLSRGASHLAINVPGQLGGSSSGGPIWEMRGERTPQEMHAGVGGMTLGMGTGSGTPSARGPLSAKELQARDLHLSLRAHPTHSRSMSGSRSMSMALAPGGVDGVGVGVGVGGGGGGYPHAF